MSKTFAIKPDNENLKADSKGYAEVVFTVTNTSSRAARGLAKLKALDETKQEWLKIKGEAERDFSPGTPEHIVVAFEGPVLPPKSAGPPKKEALPASGTRTEALAVTAPTKYGFRLDVANAALSDEDFTESQIVTVEAAIAQEKKGFPIWIIPVAAVVVIGIGLGLFFLFRPRPVPVPNVIGKTLDDAKATIEKAKLVAVEDQSQVTHTHQPGEVIDQIPKEGEQVKKGTEIKLTVEGTEPLVQVPDVVKRLVDDAKQRLTDAGLTAVITATPVPEGFQTNQVVSQKPGPDQQAPPGSSVELTVAAEKLVPVPDVRFNPLAIAKQKLAAVGLTAEEQTPELADASVAPGNIKSQNPAAGAEVPPKSTIKLVVAANPTQVPPLKGKKIAEAQFLLQQKGLEMVVFGTYNEANAATVLITGQSPAAFANVASGSKVVAFVPCVAGGCKWLLLQGAGIKTSISVPTKTSIAIPR